MKPTTFHPKETNYKGDESKNIGDLNVLRVRFSTGPALVSCWRPSLRERLKILFGGRVYLAVLGTVQPPVIVTAEVEEVLGDSKSELELATW